MFLPRRGWRGLLLAGAVGVLVAGCGPDKNQAKLAPPPTAQPNPNPGPNQPPPPPFVPPGPNQNQPNPNPPIPDPNQPTFPPVGPGPGPGVPPGFPPVSPTPGGVFVDPNPPRFDPNPQPPVQPPVQPPPVQPPVQPPPPTDPPKTDPPKTDPPPSTTPEPPKYPDKVGGRSLESWLKELEYGGAGPMQRDDHTRELAVRAIPAFGPTARAPAVKPLIAAITADPDPGVQIAAISVISSMGFDMREQVKPVIQVLRVKLRNSVPGSTVRMYCVRSLGSFGPDAAAAVAEFADCCLDKSWETRREIAIAISLIGATPTDAKTGKKVKEESGPSVKAIETLLNYQLRDQSSVVRMEAVKSLLALGPPYAKSPEEYIKDTDTIRKAAADIVKFETGKGGKVNKYGGYPDKEVAAWALLLELMYDKDKVKDNIKAVGKFVSEPSGDNAVQVRLTALQALGAAGKLSVPAIPTICDALKYKDEPALVFTAMSALALIGRDAEDAIPDLEKLVREPVKPLAKDAPAWAKPDDSMQKMAKQTIEVIKGNRKMEKYGYEDPPPAKPGDKPAEGK